MRSCLAKLIKFHTKVAHSAVVVALCAHSECLVRSFVYVTKRDQSSAESAEYLIRALKYTENAMECEKPGEEELHALWKLCVEYLRSAAVAVGYHYGNYHEWDCACHRMARFAEKLTPAVRLVNTLYSTRLAPDLTEIKRRLTVIFKQINDSPWVQRPTSGTAQNLATKPLHDTIENITLTLQRMASCSAQESTAIKRFQTAADKVNVDQSPAHPHIKQCCWLSAAEQMRLATAAITQVQNEQHQLRSALQTKIALGPLTTTSEYFVKADLAVSPPAKHLWRQAAQLSLATVVPFIQHCLLRDTLSGNEAHFADPCIARLQRARQLAYAAACCEEAHMVSTDSASSAYHELKKAEFGPRLAVLELDAAGSSDNRGSKTQGVPLLRWCEQQQRSAICTVSAPGALTTTNEERQQAQLYADAQFARACWLCKTMARVVRTYAAKAVLNFPTASSDHVMHSLDAFLKQIVEQMAALTDPRFYTLMDSAVDALEEGQCQTEQSGRVRAAEKEKTAANHSTEQFRCCAEYTAVGALRKCIPGHHAGDSDTHLEADSCLEKGQRARQAGRWYSAAAQAAATEQWEACSAFSTAAALTAEGCVDSKSANDSKSASHANWDILRPIAVRAGERFARAAEAQLTGDRELYEMWLKAAQATVGPLKVLGWQGSSSLQPVGDPEALARAAQQRQDAMNAEKGAKAGRDGLECEQDIGEGSTCVVM
jgi:hypothetical protein